MDIELSSLSVLFKLTLSNRDVMPRNVFFFILTKLPSHGILRSVSPSFSFSILGMQLWPARSHSHYYRRASKNTRVRRGTIDNWLYLAATERRTSIQTLRRNYDHSNVLHVNIIVAGLISKLSVIIRQLVHPLQLYNIIIVYYTRQVVVTLLAFVSYSPQLTGF